MLLNSYVAFQCLSSPGACVSRGWLISTTGNLCRHTTTIVEALTVAWPSFLYSTSLSFSLLHFDCIPFCSLNKTLHQQVKTRWKTRGLITLLALYDQDPRQERIAWQTIKGFQYLLQTFSFLFAVVEFCDLSSLNWKPDSRTFKQSRVYKVKHKLIFLWKDKLHKKQVYNVLWWAPFSMSWSTVLLLLFWKHSTCNVWVLSLNSSFTRSLSYKGRAELCTNRGRASTLQTS